MAQGSWSNDSITTLVVPTGATSGKRVVIANQQNGDAVDTYDEDGDLVFRITSDGSIVQVTDYGDFSVGDGTLQWHSTSPSGLAQVFFTPDASPSQGAEVTTVVNGTGGTYSLMLAAASASGTQKATAIGTERGVTGSLMQSDRVSTDSLVHVGRYSVTTNASANVTFSHGCSFTPDNSVISTVGQASPNQYVVTAYTSTQCTLHVTNAAGANLVSALTNFTAVFYG
jgi:hypothetical protein